MRINRTALFFVALAVWWAVAVGMRAGGGGGNYVVYSIALTIIFGSIYALPVVVFAALADIGARTYCPGRPALAFLGITYGGFLIGMAWLQSQQALAAVTKSPGEYGFVSAVGIPSLAVIGLYTLANLLPQPKPAAPIATAEPN